MINFLDAQQQALSFLIQQATHIEPQVYAIRYPDIQYARLLPIDTSAGEWANTVTFFSMDKVGAAQWFNANSNDMPRADITREKFTHNIDMAGIGYGYNLQEIAVAMQVPNTNLSADRAMAAKRAYEEFMEALVLTTGDADKNMECLLNYTGIDAVNVPGDGTSSSTDWEDKTAAQITRDINLILTGIMTDSKTVEMADTLLLPLESYTLIAEKQVPNTTMTVLQWVQQHNAYTALTGQALTIRVLRQLSTAGAAGVGRMIAYRNDIGVLKVHMPMPHRFLPVWQTGPMRFDVPGIFRTGGLEIRRPGAVRYGDGIMTPTTV